MDSNSKFVVQLTPLGFQVVECETGAVVIGHAGTGCRILSGQPVFAARHHAQSVADDLNES